MHKAPKTQTPFHIPFDVENGKHDLLRHLIAQEINLIIEDIEIALKEEMKKEINLGALERQCAHLQFQEPRTKLWLFDTLVTPTLL